MEIRRPRRRGLFLWAGAGAGALILVVVLIAALLASFGGDDSSPHQTAQPTGQAGAPSPSPSSAVVTPEVTALGWVPEPITRDPEEYARAALEAAGTFDTTLASRREWVAWLETWFTPSPLYDDPQDGVDQMARYKVELDRSVLLPQGTWDDLAGEDGSVSARVVGELEYLDLPETTQKQIWTATADVVLTYTRSADTDGSELTYDETVRVSVQVVCDGVSVPAPESAQQAGDCKVIRFFDEAVG